MAQVVHDVDFQFNRILVLRFQSSHDLRRVFSARLAVDDAMNLAETASENAGQKSNHHARYYRTERAAHETGN